MEKFDIIKEDREKNIEKDEEEKKEKNEEEIEQEEDRQGTSLICRL